MAVVDTGSSELFLYVAVHVSQIPDIAASYAIKPQHVMSVTPERSWVPLHVHQSAAFSRAVWGTQECGISVRDPEREIVLLQIRFSALGVGHYLMTMNLSTANWKQFRFYGNVPLQCINQDGNTLTEVISDVLAIV